MKRQTNPKQPRKKRKLYIRLVSGLVVLALILVIIHIFSRLNQPVTAPVKASQGQASATVYNIDLTPTPIAGPYASFNYPKGLRLVSKALISVPSVEDFTFYIKDVYSWTLAVDVAHTPTGTLSESSSYMLRKDNPSTYSESFITIKGQPISVMTDTTAVGSFSKVAYLTHGTLVATVSLIGNDTTGTQPLQTTLAMVLNSWQWL
jgi:hypothetical protein